MKTKFCIFLKVFHIRESLYQFLFEFKNFESNTNQDSKNLNKIQIKIKSQNPKKFGQK